MSTIDEEELKRRESYLRACNRPYNLVDPFTWSYPAKTATFTFFGLFSLHCFYAAWSRKPVYFGVFVAYCVISNHEFYFYITKMFIFYLYFVRFNFNFTHYL